MHEAQNPVGAVETTLKLLSAIKEHDGLTLGEAATALDMSKGTIHNHCSTLKEHGYLVQNDDVYDIGIRFFEFGEYVKGKKKICDVGIEQVDMLAEETGELGNLLIEEHGQGVYLHRAYGEQALQLDTGVGARVYLHTTGLGKAILAHLPDERVDRIVDAYGLPKSTAQTITDRDELDAELETIRERGYALDMQERAEGVRCVAAVVQTSDGDVLGAMSVAGPISRMDEDRMHGEIAENVKNAAEVAGINATYI